MSAQRRVYEAHDGGVRNDMGNKGGWGVWPRLSTRLLFFLM